MIAAHFGQELLEARTSERLAAALGHCPGRRTSHEQARQLACAVLEPTSAANPVFGKVGDVQVLFHGVLHNQAHLIACLGLQDTTPPEIYAHAVARWGDEADRHVIGHYCAIVAQLGSEGLRLARSPFSAPPLHARLLPDAVTASSLQRPLFWQEGKCPQPDELMVASRMLADFTDRRRGWYPGCHRVPLGRVWHVSPAGIEERWCYRLDEAPKPDCRTAEQWTERARALLDEAVGCMIAGSRKVGSLVTAGLDSAQVAASAALQLAPAPLEGFTYGPERVPDHTMAPGFYADERQALPALAAMHPNLRLHQTSNAGQDFRHGQRDLMRVIDCVPPSLTLCWHLHDLFEQARERGCDVMLCGDFGNETISNGAPWAFVEYFLGLRWWQLWLALKHHRIDRRPLWRRFVTYCLMPLLPAPIWRWVLGMRHGGAPDPLASSGISREFAARHALVEQARAGGFDPEFPPIRSRRAFWDMIMAEDGQDIAEFAQAMELLHGISYRDPTAYRPLVEFCYRAPTDLYLRDGIDRWLAREMARGRLPDAQRQNRLQGAHEVDWHLRLGRARNELLEDLSRMEDDPDIVQVVDLPRLRALLEHFPEESSSRTEDFAPYVTALVRGMTAARFIAYTKGRNDI